MLINKTFIGGKNMENKKFEFTEETKTTPWGATLKRIVALRDFGDVKVGDKGGFLEKEENLSHDNDCWVYDEARVYGEARVCDEARVTTVVKTFGNGFDYRNTVTDKHIKIGCQQHLKSEWYNFQEGEIMEMDGKRALKFWRIFKPLAEQLGLFEEI